MPQLDSRLERFLHSRFAPWLTHGSLLLMTGAFFALLLWTPYAVAFFPCVLLGHRIGVLLHEYFHGIPFRKYSHNLIVATIWDALLLFFGMLEFFRGTHLAHHRWLNTEQDSARESAQRVGKHTLLDVITGLEAVQQFIYLYDAMRGRKPYIKGGRVALGFVLSCGTAAAWIALGRGDVLWKLAGVSLFTTLGPISLRAAIEHHSHTDDPGFANEYRVWIPLFNLNKHIHHHEEPTVPWYLLQYRTPDPLPEWRYFSYWYRVYIKKELVLMRPMPRRSSVPEAPQLDEGAAA